MNKSSSSSSIMIMTLLAIFTTICIALFFVVGTIAGFIGLFAGFIPGMAIWGFLILLAIGLVLVAVLLIKQ